MSKNTKIQWCDSTANPTMGCDGCELWGPKRKTCYAGLLHTRFGGVTPGYAPSFGEVTLFPGRMAIVGGHYFARSSQTRLIVAYISPA